MRREISAPYTDWILYRRRSLGIASMSPLPVPRLLNRPPRWLGGLVAVLLACNLAAFKVAAPAAGCRGAPATVTKACCAMRPGGCCCKTPASNDGTPAWRAPGCAQRVAAGLIHPQWEPVLLAEATVPGTATPAAIDTGAGPLFPRGADPPPVPPPQVA